MNKQSTLAELIQVLESAVAPELEGKLLSRGWSGTCYLTHQTFHQTIFDIVRPIVKPLGLDVGSWGMTDNEYWNKIIFYKRLMVGDTGNKRFVGRIEKVQFFPMEGCDPERSIADNIVLARIIDLQETQERYRADIAMYLAKIRTGQERIEKVSREIEELEQTIGGHGNVEG